MQLTARRFYFIGILVLAAVWIFLSADPKGTTTAGLIPAPQAGFLAPDFTLETLDGESVTLSGLRGQVVLVNFWATWCPPCRAEMPAIEQAYTDYANDDFVILAVNATQQDSLGSIETFQSEYGLSFPILLDTESEMLVQEAIERLLEGRTTFVIAHRLSTIQNASKILVLEDGRLKERGTHSELLMRDGIYRRLYDLQFGLAG